MFLQKINLGTTAGDKTGDGARIAGAKINANFQYLNNKIENRNKVLVNGGFTQNGNEIVLNSGWQWVINGVLYLNPVPVIIDIPVAGAGLSRIDNIVATTSNTFTRMPGTESATPVTPIFIEGTIVVAFAIINDTAIQNSGNVDPEKLDRAGYTGTALTLRQEITSLDQGLNTRIDDVAYEIQEVQLPLKADKLTTYTKDEVDLKVTGRFLINRNNLMFFADEPITGDTVTGMVEGEYLNAGTYYGGDFELLNSYVQPAVGTIQSWYLGWLYYVLNEQYALNTNGTVTAVVNEMSLDGNLLPEYELFLTSEPAVSGYSSVLYLRKGSTVRLKDEEGFYTDSNTYAQKY